MMRIAVHVNKKLWDIVKDNADDTVLRQLWGQLQHQARFQGHEQRRWQMWDQVWEELE